MSKSPKILFFDIETTPIEAYVWGLFDQNIALEQIKEDWSVLSWSAKWLGQSKILYEDTRDRRNVRDDKQLLKGIWKLLDAADIVVTQNGKKFDSKKLNARFIIHEMRPPSSYQHIDTLEIDKKYFAFTSNKLAYVSEVLCPNQKKSSHKEFPGFLLWKECLAGNRAAFREMEKYNKQDVLALEALYNRISPWDSRINFNVYLPGDKYKCKCGGASFMRRGFKYTPAGKFQQYSCKDCGAWHADKRNLLSKSRKASLGRAV